MNRIVDSERMVASLREGARSAMIETNDQAGPKAPDIALRLRNELRIATLNWSTVEAFNSSFEEFRDQLIEQEAWQPAIFAVRALVRDVVVTLFRITDSSEKDAQSICALVKALEGRSDSEIEELTGANRDDITAGLAFIQARVPRKWSSNPLLPDGALAELRTTLRPIRDSLITHAKIYSSLDLRSSVSNTRQFLQLTSELSDAACMVCNVPRDNFQDRWHGALAESHRFWQVVAAGSKSASTV